jgi:hypothetical protein
MVDLALDLMMARAYCDALYEALTNMRAATEAQGVPSADELIEAIDYALNKANLASIQVREAFLAGSRTQEAPQ